MTTIQDSRKVSVALVIRLDDFTTGYAITNDKMLKIISADGFFLPVIKPDGYFVFTNHRPEAVRITSDKYQSVLLSTDNHAGTVLRLSIISKDYCGNTFTLDGEAHVGFGGNGAGYFLSSAVTTDFAAITPQKDDLRDITDLYHALISSDGNAESVFVTKNLGNGQYALQEPPKRDYPARGTRLFPLYRVMGGEIPIPSGVETAYILQNGKLTTQAILSHAVIQQQGQPELEGLA